MHVFRPFRQLAVALIAVTALLAPAAVASARTLVEVEGIASPPITVFTTTPQSINVTLDFDFRSDVADELPGTVAKSTIFITHGARLNGALFPSCDPGRLARLRGLRRACPSGSRIGGGTALGTSPTFAGVNERLTVDIYNGPRGRSMLFYFQGLNPVAVSGIINAPLVPLRGGDWGYRLTLRVPEGLQQISRGIFASLLHIQTKLGATVSVREGGRTVRHGFIEALACPPRALVPLRTVFDFRDGSSTTTDAYIACGHR